ncbi:MAG TPA: hypothetical protein VHE61_01930 [Opitutaceae bacterium]|nr:hypothetical protein [Opitutaceae bacterium]
MRFRNSHVTWWASAALLVALFLAPVYRPASFATPLFVEYPWGQAAMRVLLLALIPACGWWAMGGSQLQPGEKRGVLFLALACGFVGEVIHYWVVDHGTYFATIYFADNTAWQRMMHEKIVGLSPAHTPHSFRFLPDAIVSVFIWLTGKFVFSRVVYRAIFNVMLFVCVYRFARVYLSTLFSAGVVLVLTIVYPISILKYAGQFVDPASHLSFALCYFAMARQYDAPFIPSVLVGILCKESIIVMPLCRLLAGPWRRRKMLVGALGLTAAVALAFWIRFYVARGNPAYMIDHVHPGHLWQNLHAYREWAPLYLASFGILLPGTVLGWRLMDRSFQITCLVVVVAMIVSSARYSWLAELRNLVPAFILMAVVNMRYLEAIYGAPTGSSRATGPIERGEGPELPP